MTKLNMRLYSLDEERLDILKNYYNLDSTAELVRFVLRNEAAELHRGRIKFEVSKLKDVLKKDGKGYEFGIIEHDGKLVRDVFFAEEDKFKEPL